MTLTPTMQRIFDKMTPETKENLAKLEEGFRAKKSVIVDKPNMEPLREFIMEVVLATVGDAVTRALADNKLRLEPNDDGSYRLVFDGLNSAPPLKM